MVGNEGEREMQNKQKQNRVDMACITTKKHPPTLIFFHLLKENENKKNERVKKERRG